MTILEQKALATLAIHSPEYLSAGEVAHEVGCGPPQAAAWLRVCLSYGWCIRLLDYGSAEAYRITPTGLLALLCKDSDWMEGA